MLTCDVAVVGTGLFGSIIAAALRSSGANVATVDDKRPLAGSKPAACLMKPSWYSGLGPGVFRPALALLDEHYGLRTLEFRLQGAVKTHVHWVDPEQVLLSPDICETVVKIAQGGRRWVLKMGSGLELEANSVVVAAGVWTSELSPVAGLQPRAGAAFLWPDPLEETQPFINVWAPYRQLVAFHRAPGELWVGDGTALKTMSLNETQLTTSLKRCASAVGFSEDRAQTLQGLRPYVPKAKPAYLSEHLPGLWVATGGAKNGTLAAAWCASQLRGALQ